MWQRFTEKARQIVYQSQQEAIGLGENYVWPAHLLLGLLDVEGNLGLRVLERLGIQPEEVRSEIMRQTAHSEANDGKDMQLTPQAKKAIDLAYEEARRLKNKYIGGEHLLLGLIAEGEGLAARVLTKLGVTLDFARQAVVELQAEPKPGEELLTMDEAVQFLNTSKPTLYRVLGEGGLKGLKVGRQWRFRKADLVAYMERSPVAVAAESIDNQDNDLDVPLELLNGLLRKIKAASSDQQVTAEAARSALDVGNAEKKIIMIAHKLMQYAIAMHASDLHLEPAREDGVNFVRVRYRLDGVMQEICRLPFGVQEALTIRLKTMADMNVNEKRLPQDGRIPVRDQGKDYTVRVSSVPSVFGESIVMSIVDYGNLQFGLDDLGLAADDLTQIRELLQRPTGLFIATGPTGSGKMTVMYSCLKELANGEVKTITIEDPIEVPMPFVTQSQVNKRTGVTFAGALRAFLNQDPDIIYVSETGDSETAQLTAEASLTGHLVLTTMLANDAPSVLSRLLDMGLKPYLIAATIIGIVAQRLCRRICDHCKEFYEVPARELIRFGLTPDDPAQTVTLARGKGCEKCRQRGFLGRICLFELLTMTDEIADLVVSGAPQAEVAAAARAAGMNSLWHDGLLKVLDGVTTPEEVLRVCAAV